MQILIQIRLTSFAVVHFSGCMYPVYVYRMEMFPYLLFPPGFSHGFEVVCPGNLEFIFHIIRFNVFQTTCFIYHKDSVLE